MCKLTKEEKDAIIDQCETSIYHWDMANEEQDRSTLLKKALKKFKEDHNYDKK